MYGARIYSGCLAVLVLGIVCGVCSSVPVCGPYDIWLDVGPTEAGVVAFGTDAYRASYSVPDSLSWRLEDVNGTLYMYPLFLDPNATVWIYMLKDSMCGSTPDVLNFTGTPESPMGPYPVIQSPGSRVQMTFTHDPHNDSLTDHTFVLRYLSSLKQATISTTSYTYVTATTEFQQLKLKSVAETCHMVLQQPEPGRVIRISVVYMDLQETADCGQDVLEIYDGDGVGDVQLGPLLLRTCRSRGTFTPYHVFTTGPKAVIKLGCSVPSTDCAILNYIAHDYSDYSYIYMGYEPPSPSDATYDIYQATNVQATIDYSSITSLHDQGFRMNEHHVLFSVMASHSATILLQKYRRNFHKDIFEIVLDAENEMKAVIRSDISFQPGGPPEVVHYLTYRLLDSYTHQNFWISWQDDYVKIGHGSMVGYGVIFRSQKFPDLRDNVKFLTVAAGSGSGADWSISGACDHGFLFPHEQTLDPWAFHISYTFNYDSARSVYWMITKYNPDERLTLAVTSNTLLTSPNCIAERVSIYKGRCPNPSNMIGYFCGPSRDTFSQSVYTDTLIYFTTRHLALPPDQTRSFTITYTVDGINYNPSQVYMSINAEPSFDAPLDDTSPYPHDPWPEPPTQYVNPFFTVPDWMNDSPPPPDEDGDGGRVAWLVLRIFMGLGLFVIVMVIGTASVIAHNKHKRRRSVQAQRTVTGQPATTGHQHGHVHGHANVPGHGHVHGHANVQGHGHVHGHANVQVDGNVQGHANVIAPAPVDGSPAQQNVINLYQSKYVGGVPPPAVYIPPYEQLYSGNNPQQTPQPPPPPYNQCSPQPATGGQDVHVASNQGNVPAYPQQPSPQGPHPGAYPAQPPAYGTTQIDPMNPPVHHGLPRRPPERKDSCILS